MQHNNSDQLIPRLSDILDRACDLLGSAYRLQDDRSAGQLERLIAKLPFASLSWELGTLHIASASGNVYHVTRGGCDCPNAKAGKRQCYHLALFGILEDMIETDAETLDMEAEAPSLWRRVTRSRMPLLALL